MAIRRYKKKPNFYNRFRKYGNAVMKGASLAYSAYKGVQYLKSVVNVERHYFDTSVVSASVTNAGSITCLNQIAAGTDAPNRIGNSILGKYITGKITVQDNATAGATEGFVRILIFQDLENIGTDPTLSQILQDTSNPVVSPINIDNTPRFWVLVDKTYTVDDSNKTRVGKFYRLMIKNAHIKFTGTASGNYAKNSLYLLAVSDDASNGPILTFANRLCFIDN